VTPTLIWTTTFGIRKGKCTVILKFYRADFLQKQEIGHFYSVEISFPRVFSFFLWWFLSITLTKFQSNKNRGSPDLFSCKILWDFTNSTHVFMLVKSEFFKNMGYSCAVLTTTDCACTLAGIQSLQRGKKLHASNLHKLLGFPVQYNVW